MRIFAIGLTSLLLVACGGGGGGGVPSASSTAATIGEAGGVGVPSASGTAATTFTLRSAVANLYQTGYLKTVTVTGTALENTTAYPLTGSFQITESPANISTTFLGQAALQQTVTLRGTLTENGKSINLTSTATGYLTTNYDALGVITPTSYCESSTPGVTPVTVKVGDAGTVVAYSCYTDSGKVTPTGTQKVSYKVSAGSSDTTAIFSSVNTFSNTANQITEASQTNYLIDTSGNLSFLSISISGLISGVPVTFTAQ